MVVELNLLPDKKESISPADAGLGKSLRKFSLAVLILTAVAALSVIAFQQAVALQKADLENKIANFERVIDENKDKEILLVLLKQKIMGIQTVISRRPDMAKEMMIIKSSLPQGSSVVGFTGEKSGKLSIDFVVDNSQTLDTLITTFSQNKRYRDMAVSDLEKDVSAGYKFTLGLEAKEGSWL